MIDLRPHVLFPTSGKFFLVRWVEYNGHFIALSRTVEGAFRAYHRRCEDGKELLVIKDLMWIQTGPPPDGYLDKMRDAWRAIVDTQFQSAMMDAVREYRLLMKRLPPGFLYCQTYELPPGETWEPSPYDIRTHQDCIHCIDRIRPRSSWDEMRDRAGHLWTMPPQMGAFRPYPNGAKPLSGNQIFDVTVGSYGICFSQLPSVDLFQLDCYLPRIHFFFEELERVEVPNQPLFKEFQDRWMERERKWRERNAQKYELERKALDWERVLRIKPLLDAIRIRGAK